ncbi:MAG TPA: MotA/TolQ/ExbB proton channel family protein [Gammaproteobacteria bacterium]|nr:MotA/TolQ/ExbB proton channel family protein [Gammaproteobacteria bacterium]
MRDDERRVAQERLTRFRNEQQRQERLAQEAVTRRNNAEARSVALDRQWQANEGRIAELTELLRQHEGNLGELFGVTRQVAGDAATVLQQSLVTTQYVTPPDGEERAEFLRRLAGARALPSISELERLWYELLREMTDGGRVVKFNTSVLQTDSVTNVDMEVVRVGPFTAVSNGEYLGYLPSRRSLTSLTGQVPGEFQAIGRRLQAASADGGYARAIVDPARGALLGLYVERPNPIERIQEGEVVGYVIVFVGVLGVLLAVFQAVYLVLTRLAVGAQLRNLSDPKPNNPLGRVLLAFRGDGKRIENAELAELRISEAVLREVPKLERFQAFLRLAVAAGPLLGLIGTVIGMIITFKAIVASGSSDPRLMATGIGQAMIATVLGLGIAIPLLFINSGLVVLSRSVTQILDEQSTALLAASTGARKTAV